MIRKGIWDMLLIHPIPINPHYSYSPQSPGSSLLQSIHEVSPNNTSDEQCYCRDTEALNSYGNAQGNYAFIYLCVFNIQHYIHIIVSITNIILCVIVIIFVVTNLYFPY